jgi:hypothetical protein
MIVNVTIEIVLNQFVHLVLVQLLLQLIRIVVAKTEIFLVWKLTKVEVDQIPEF